METKKCTYCGEEIKINAQKCKHCGEWLNTQNNRDLSQNKIYPELIEFKQQYGGSTILMLFLNCLFNSFYMVYIAFWLGERYKAFNKIGKNAFNSVEVKPSLLIWYLITCSSVGFINLYLPVFFSNNNWWDRSIVITYYLICSVACFITYLMVIFKLADLLENFVKRITSRHYKLNRVLLFFFSIYYLNYKINRLDTLNT